MQYETIRAAICDDEEFFRNELKKFVSEYANEMDINVSIDLYFLRVRNMIYCFLMWKCPA